MAVRYKYTADSVSSRLLSALIDIVDNPVRVRARLKYALPVIMKQIRKEAIMAYVRKNAQSTPNYSGD